MNYTPLILFALGAFGILMHNLIKMDELNRKANGDFKFGQYLSIEKFSIMLSVCVVIVCIMISREIKQLADLGKWLGLSFVAVGYMAQSLLVKVMGRAERVINDKTN